MAHGEKKNPSENSVVKQQNGIKPKQTVHLQNVQSNITQILVTGFLYLPHSSFFPPPLPVFESY